MGGSKIKVTKDCKKYVENWAHAHMVVSALCFLGARVNLKKEYYLPIKYVLNILLSKYVHTIKAKGSSNKFLLLSYDSALRPIVHLVET